MKEPELFDEHVTTYADPEHVPEPVTLEGLRADIAKLGPIPRWAFEAAQAEMLRRIRDEVALPNMTFLPPLALAPFAGEPSVMLPLTRHAPLLSPEYASFSEPYTFRYTGPFKGR